MTSSGIKPMTFWLTVTVSKISKLTSCSMWYCKTNYSKNIARKSPSYTTTAAAAAAVLHIVLIT
jgi:hypothetical protein